jgi:hypothetical protein
VLLIVNWQGSAALHADAVKRWSTVLALFRNRRSADGCWPEQYSAELSKAYWDAANNTIFIPESYFNSLKAHHLRKIEMSKMIDKRPWCPQLFIRIQLICRDIIKKE